MSNRITNVLRDSIVNILSGRAFGEKLRVAREARQTAANNLVAAMWGDDLKAMLKIRERAGSKLCGRYFYIGGCHFASDYPVPSDFDDTFDFQKVGNKNRFIELHQTLLDLNTEYLKVEKARDQLNSDVRAVLASVQTYKALYKIWPELEELKEQIGDTAQSPSAKALVVQVDALNKIIGLPTPTKVEVETTVTETPVGKKLRVKVKKDLKAAA